jgi:hypothetical protein
VTEEIHRPAAPETHDAVEVIDVQTGHRVTAAVEDASGGTWQLLFDLAAAIPHDAALHWDDGDVGWQATAHLEHLEATTATYRVASSSDWQPSPVRRSLRTPVDNWPMLVRVSKSAALAEGRRVHAVCLDISDSGCRVSWPATPPLVGDAVAVTWETSHWGDREGEWFPARVARVTALPFGVKHVGLQFIITDSTHALHAHRWSSVWHQEHRRRSLARRRLH